MLLDILMIYLFATLNLPTWFLVIVIIDVVMGIIGLCIKK
nr:MAG TPA: hypothetical protein [Bacteriophage sp.]